ncbi:ABC-2 transporter permease [Lysinibacillus sp. NPDC056232]|uniref:ABC-2 transporter permease n=1 Tax=Lysinibacillus sp. NPDC056232 TaxID=3345756 RepID=UPI0035DC1FAB
MRGLLLTNYYLVFRSLFVYIGVALLGSGLIFYFGDTSIHRYVAFITLFVAMPALEVIKHEGKSGYDKYVLTLPVSRTNIVQSHYFFYFTTVVIGTLLSCGIFYIHGLVSDTPLNGIYNTVSLGTFIVLFAGAVAFPFLYVFGSEKSDVITVGGAIGGYIATLGIQSLIRYLTEPLSNLNIDPSFYVPIIFLTFGVVIYILSFFIATFIYYKKEF